MQALNLLRGRNVLTWIAFPLILLVYLLFPTKNYYWDGITFVRAIESARFLNPSLLHPNHLLYNVAGYGLYKLAHAIGLTPRALDVLQVANSLVSVATAAMLYRLLQHVSKSQYLAWSLTLMFAFSATWWKYSTDADAYVFSVFFLLLTFLFVLPERKPRPLLAALTFSIAVLIHELAVLVYPVIALAIFWQAATRERRQEVSKVAQFCVTSLLMILGIYFYCFYVATNSTDVPRFLRWVTSASPDASFGFDPISNLGYTLRGNVRLVFNARPSLLRGLLTPPIIALLAVFLLFVLAWLLTLLRSVKRIKLNAIAGRLSSSRLARLCLLWIGIYLIFLFFWLPHNTFYRLFYLLPLILLFAIMGSSGHSEPARKRTYGLALFVAAMALSNFLFFIYPYSKIEKHPPLSIALEMSSLWKPGTVVYFQSENSDNNLAAYFNPSIEWRPVNDLSQMDLEISKIYYDGKSAWFDASAIDHVERMPEGNQWLSRHAKAETRRERNVRGYNLKFVQIVP